MSDAMSSGWSWLARAAALALLGCGPEADPDPPATVAEGIFGALGDPVAFASTEERAAFDRGRDVVARVFTPETGLGPEFNVVSCGGCHEKPVFGGSAARYRDFYLVGSRLGDGSFITPRMAGILHAYGLAEAPRPGLTEDWNVQTRRNPLPFFGAGLIAELSDDVILANADPSDADGDGISGRPNYDNGFVGRFGRKAQTVSIEGFIRGPLNNHLGITTDPLTDAQRAALPVDSSAPAAGDAGGLQGRAAALSVRVQAQAAPPSEPLFDSDGVADPELNADDLFDVVSFAMLLAVPTPAAPTPESERGALSFEELGCASCHVPELEGPRGLIPLYSDLLLHDMGPELADGLDQGLATGAEFRTQPLWGVAAVAPYLHDGRADTLDAAIRLHGGEAEATRDAYVALPEVAQLDVVAFLESLGGIEQRSEGLIPPGAPIEVAGTLGGPARSLAGEEEALFLEGRRLFDRDFGYGEGLGPEFNGDSCRACHFQAHTAGAGPLDVNVIRHATYHAALDVVELPPRGSILPKLTRFDLPRVEPSDAINVFEPRQTPHAFGLGAIEGIDAGAIRAGADPDDADGDGISGRAHELADGRLGRFGWKAQVPSVREFIRDAMGAELGITTPAEVGLTFGSRSDFDGGADPELSVDALDALTFYLSSLAAPPAAPDAAGEAVFVAAGCAGCHTEELPGAAGPVRLFSDLLLHDVAAAGVRGIVDGDARDREFRTPPLWGLSVTGPYMHDGSAATVEVAISGHFGEADAARRAFEGLSTADRGALVRFLEAL